jgi:hypothetical protein
MSIQVKIKHNLEQKDWLAYEQVWEKSGNCNPFIAPSLLKLQNSKTLKIAFIHNYEEAIGAIPLHLQNGVLSLAGEEKSDIINFSFLPTVPIYLKQEAVKETFKFINFRGFVSCKLANNGFDYLLVMQALKQLGFKLIVTKAIKNPLVSFNNNEYTDEKFLKVFSKRNTRNYCNKLQKNFGYTITAIQQFEESEVKNWLENFFTFHIARWNATKTPSIYSDRIMREDLYQRVKAWLNDKVGLLFSVDVAGKPFAMAICLKKAGTVIYHQISSTGEGVYSRYPKQKILILELVKWMLENGFKSIDFGVGVEPYKYEYTNKDPYTMRIYAAKSVYSKIYLKGAIDYHYQKNLKLQNLLNGIIRPTIGKVKNKVSLFKAKLKVNLQETNGSYLGLLKKFIRKGKPEIEFFYRFKNTLINGLKDGERITKVGMLDVLNFYEKELLLSPQKKLYYVNVLVENTKEPWGLYTSNNKLAALAWLADPAKHQCPQDENIENLKVIIDCITAKNHRGNGYYPILINYLAREQKDSSVMIYTHDWNIASQRGITKAGFEKIIIRKTTKTKYEWLQIRPKT